MCIGYLLIIVMLIGAFLLIDSYNIPFIFGIILFVIIIFGGQYILGSILEGEKIDYIALVALVIFGTLLVLLFSIISPGYSPDPDHWRPIP